MRKSGHITIFVCMTLVLVCALLFTTVEAARTAASAVAFRMAAASAVESAFGEYYRPLWDRYHLLALYEEEPLEERVAFYLDQNRPGAGEGGVSFLRFEEAQVQVREVTRLADADARYLQENGADYMKYHVVSEALEDLADQFGLLTQIRKAAGFVKGLAAFAEDIFEAEACVGEIGQLAGRIRDNLMEARGIAESLMEKMGTPPASGEAVDAEFQERAAEAGRELGRLYRAVDSDCQRLAEKMARFERIAGRLAEKLEEWIREFEDGEYTGAIRELLEERLEQIREYSANGGARYEAVRNLAAKLREGGALLEEFSSLIREGLPADAREAWSQVRDLGGRLLAFGSVSLPEWLQQLGQWEAEEPEWEAPDVLAWTEEGLLKWILGEEVMISDAQMAEEDRISTRMPRSGSDFGEAADPASGQPGSGIGSELLFREYLADHLSCYRENQKGHFMRYEWEYLLGDSFDDRENLLSVIGDLLLVREGVNFLAYLSDEAKCQEAAAAAAALVGVTGNPVLVSVLQTGFLAVWALQEAVEDVREVADGGTVPLLSLFGQEWVPLNYQGYLRVLTAFRDTESLRYRCLDLIQASMKREDPEFQILRCLYGAEVEVQAGSGTLFGRLPLIREIGGVEVREGTYQAVRRFTYDS